MLSSSIASWHGVSASMRPRDVKPISPFELRIRKIRRAERHQVPVAVSIRKSMFLNESSGKSHVLSTLVITGQTSAGRNKEGKRNPDKKCQVIRKKAAGGLGTEKNNSRVIVTFCGLSGFRSTSSAGCQAAATSERRTMAVNLLHEANIRHEARDQTKQHTHTALSSESAWMG